MKQCVRCLETKESNHFYTRKGVESGLSSWCKKCIKENRSPVSYDQRRKRHLKHTYQLSLDEYDQMLIEQEERCAICRGTNRDDRPLFVDHCHTTGKVRGLLCNDCNVMLGRAQDNEIILMRAIDYLKEHNV